MKKLTTEEFIERAKAKHGDRYSYERCEYVNARTPVTVTCHVHGDFEQNANDHRTGYGCPKCGGTGRLNTREVIERFKLVHGEKYDYSRVQYVRATQKVDIICPVHGVFEQIAHSHMDGNGCPACRIDLLRDAYSYSNDDFLRKAKLAHDYPKGETELFDFVKSIAPDAVQSDRDIIAPQEVDILVPSAKVAFEFNGIYWHSEKYRGKAYHMEKRKAVEAAGYRLISVREDLWNERRAQVEAIIRNALCASQERVYARKCTIVEIDVVTASTFMQQHHVQGHRNATHYYGLTHDDSLVGVMTVTQWKKKDEWEIVRYATACNVVGGLSKLWKHICGAHQITNAYSYVDRDLFTGSSYYHGGFHYSSTSVGFRIVVGKTTESRQKWNKPPEGMTQSEWYEEEGVSRIYDSGQDKLVFQC